jgi:hypothetical protein
MQPMINTLLDPVINFGKATVSTGYSNLDTVILLAAGHGSKFPNPSTDGNFNIVWFDASTYADPSDDPNVEIVRCTARAGDTLTVVRGQEGISASNKNTPTKTYRMILSQTKKTITDIRTEYQSGVSTHSALNTGIHGVGVGTVDSVGARNTAISTHTSNVTTLHLPSQTGNTGKYLKTDGSIASWQTGTGAVLGPEQVPKIASTNIRHSNDAEVGVPYETFGLLKIIRFTNGITGTIRLYSDVYTARTDAPTWIEYRVNGTVIGSYTYGTRYPYTTIAVDATRTILPGEAIEMWGMTSGQQYGMYSLIKNYRIAYDNDPNILVAVTYI